jgi:hypothetical protein
VTSLRCAAGLASDGLRIASTEVRRLGVYGPVGAAIWSLRRWLRVVSGACYSLRP